MIFIGTSGWSYQHWRGFFYPEDVDNWLDFYAKHFHTVEINNTFYQRPEEQTLEQWRDTVPADFIFAVKAHRYITHMKKLKDPDEPVANFLQTADVLGDKLGPLLFQLPGNYFNAERLENFLQVLPKGYRYAFEFRDPSWHNDRAYELLAQYNAAFCIYEFGGYISPKETTADFVYVRLHGPLEQPYRGEYGEQGLSAWADMISEWTREDRDVYCYFDNDDSAYATRDAMRLLLPRANSTMPAALSGTARRSSNLIFPGLMLAVGSLVVMIAPPVSKPFVKHL